MKYFLGALALVAFLGGAVWLIRFEAERTRQSIDKSMEKGVDRAIDRASERITEIPGKMIDNVLGTGSETPKDGASKGTKDGNSKEGKSDQSKGTTFSPVDLIGRVFDLGHKTFKTADDVAQAVAGLNAEEEAEIGKEVSQLIRKNHRLLKAPALQERVERLARPILEQRVRKNVSYSFAIVDSAEVNAFSVLGGYIFVNKGLLDFAASDANLQFVLGHEIAHVDLKHCVNGLTFAARAQQVAGDLGANLVQLAYRMVAVGYSADLEFEADAWSYRALRKAGRSHAETVGFTRQFLEYQKQRGQETGRRKPSTVPDAVKQEINNHFATHPATEDRLRRLENMKD